MAKGGFPEPCLADDAVSADRWRMQYFNDLIREDGRLMQMIECKFGDNKPHRGLTRFGEQFPQTEVVQIVYGLRQKEFRNGIRITGAGMWLMGLSA